METIPLGKLLVVTTLHLRKRLQGVAHIQGTEKRLTTDRLTAL